MKNDLSRKFARAAVRATLAVVLTMGAMVPSITVSAQTALPAPATAITQVATQASAPVDVTFKEAGDLDSLVKQYPALKAVREEMRQADKDKLDGFKEIHEEASFRPGTLEIATYKDTINNREYLFAHISTENNMCSYEGCPLYIFAKDAKDFRQVSSFKTDVPIEVVTAKDKFVVNAPGTVNGGFSMQYNAKTDQFDPVDDATPTQQQPTPAPLQAPAPKK